MCALWAALSSGVTGCAKGEVAYVGGGAPGGTTNGGGAGGTVQISLGTTPISPATSEDAATVARPISCDGSDGCKCTPINVAVLGKPGKWSSNPAGEPDAALQAWLNGNSAGTARVDNFTDRKTLSADFLANYNVIILQSLADDSDAGPWWTFTDEEIAAFQAWVETGGGVIALTGYSNGDEITSVNRLIGFSGIAFDTRDAWAGCADQQVCNCTSSSMLSDWKRDEPVVGKLSTGVTWVGFVKGRSVTSPSDGHVGATAGGQNVLVGKIVGKGRVLAFGDEWLTYTSQWTGAGTPSANNPQCAGFTPKEKYQIPQFWYNMIHWSQPSSDCFTIESSPSAPIEIW